MITIYSADVCPFAQRPRALLTHLGRPFEVRTIDLSDRDPEFLALTPTGKVPLLIDGDLKLYESQVINDYLAEKEGWASAYAADIGLRARQRLMMKMWDDEVVAAFYRSLKDPAGFDETARGRVGRELDEMQTTVRDMGGETESLLSFHCAPHWARMDWLRARSPLPALIGERADLRAWLDLTVALPAVAITLPDRDTTVKRYEERFAGAR